MPNDELVSLQTQATAMIRRRQFSEAIPWLERCIVLAPNDAATHTLLGIAYSNSGRPEQAEQAFRQAVRLAPMVAKYHFNLATQLATMNKNADALRATEETLRLDATHSGALALAARLRPAQPTTPTGTQCPHCGAPVTANDPACWQCGKPLAAVPRGGEQTPYRTQYDPNAPANLYAPSPYQPAYGQYGYAPQWYDTFVERIGGTWVTVGWLLFLGAIAMLLAAYSAGQVVASYFLEQWRLNAAAGGALPIMSAPAEVTAAAIRLKALSLVSFAIMVGTAVWICIDIAHRRASWFWIIPLACCCYPFATPVYLLAGRNPIRPRTRM